MKKHFFVILLGLIFATSCVFYVPFVEEGPPPEAEEEYYEEPYEEPTPSPGGYDVSYFYNYLSPYGIWVYHSPYGYVWIPGDVGYGWRPYTHGHWVWTDYGWTWRSQVVWGWAPFHYGRWGRDRDLGWFWVPGTVWGPGWVTWRSSNVYIGWAPLPPGVRFVPGVGIRRFTYRIPASHWVFVGGNYFMNHSLHLHIFPHERNVTIINYTVHKTNIYVRNNRVVNEGIGVDLVRRITKKNISKHELKDTKKAEMRRVGANTLEVYRPKIKESQTAKPKKVVDRKEAKVRITEARPAVTKTGKKESAATKTQRIKEAHEREIKILERSQQREVKEIEQNLEKEKKSAKTQAEKMKIERKFREKAVKIKKSHDTEKTQIKTRHKKEEEKAKEKKTDKKKEPEKKKVKKKIKK